MERRRLPLIPIPLPRAFAYDEYGSCTFRPLIVMIVPAMTLGVSMIR